MAYCKKCHKLEKVNEKLKEVIQTIVSDHMLWQCPECSYFSPRGHRCWDCGYDPTA